MPCLRQMLDVYQRWGGTVLGVQEVRAEDTGKYGMVRPEYVGPGLYRVKDLVEKPRPEEAPSTLAVLGGGTSSSRRCSTSWRNRSRARAGRSS